MSVPISLTPNTNPFFRSEELELSYGLSLLDELDSKKYDSSKINISTRIKKKLVGTEWTFYEVSSYFSKYAVTLSDGTISVNPKPKPPKPRKSKISRCAECSIVVQLHERRGSRGRFCKPCWLSQIIDCKYCHRKIEREHRCVPLPYEKHIRGKKYRLCTQCPASGDYIAMNAFKRHVQRKHYSYMFQCSKCPDRFSCQSDLNNHMKNHTSKLSYQCQHCDKKFRWQSQLSLHMKTHPVRRETKKTVDHSLPKPEVFAVGLDAIMGLV
jgi:hypothetical protein